MKVERVSGSWGSATAAVWRSSAGVCMAEVSANYPDGVRIAYYVELERCAEDAPVDVLSLINEVEARVKKHDPFADVRKTILGVGNEGKQGI